VSGNRKGRRGGCSQIASGVIRGDVSAACDVVLLGMIGDKARATLGRTRERIVGGGRSIVLLEGVLDGEEEWKVVGNATDLGWLCGHGSSRGEGEKRDRVPGWYVFFVVWEGVINRRRAGLNWVIGVNIGCFINKKMQQIQRQSREIISTNMRATPAALVRPASGTCIPAKST